VATPPTRPALRERYDRRQGEVVLAAARVFAERGYERTSVQELTEAMGLTPAALYHYFPGKEELLIRICDQLLDPLLDRARAAVEADAPAAARLRALVRLWVGHVVTHRDHMLVFQQVRHVIEHGPAWRAVRANRKRFERLVDDALADAEEAGALVPRDRRLALAALLGMVNHTAQWYRPRGRLTPEAIADGYLELLLRDASA
jgi:TetR/AcrR family transcriptional regulator, cholesterol catabolism regulator